MIKVPIDFICLGVMKSGTTSLDSVLRTHPELSLTVKRKELHYYNNNYDKGVEWYKSFFKKKDLISDKKIVGEVSAHYLWHELSPVRIHESVGIPKFLGIFRHPVLRAYSHWKHQVINHGGTLDFKREFAEHSNMYELGLYGNQLQRYFEIFNKDNFCLFLFDDFLNDNAGTLKKIAEFLDIDPNGFHPDALSNARKNESVMPRFQYFYNFLQKITRHLRSNGHHFIPNMTSKLKIGRLFKSKNNRIPSISSNDYNEILKYYQDDILLFQKLSGLEVSSWLDEK